VQKSEFQGFCEECVSVWELPGELGEGFDPPVHVSNPPVPVIRLSWGEI